MASANILTLDDPPEIEYSVNKQGGNDLRYLNYLYHQKTSGKNVLVSSALANDAMQRSALKHIWLKERTRQKLSSHQFKFGSIHSERISSQGEKSSIDNPPIPTHQIYESEERTLST